MPPHPRRSVRYTVLMVGEGSTEQAFLKHLKALYVSRGSGIGVTIRNAHGKGADHVVDYTISQCRNADYDKLVTLLDNDHPLSDAGRQRARRAKIEVIGSTPCIESLFLQILSENIPVRSVECKRRCEQVIEGRLTEVKNYAAPFPKELLDTRRGDIPDLNLILNYLTVPGFDTQ